MKNFRERDLKAARLINALCSFHFEDNEGIKQFLQKMSKYTCLTKSLNGWKIQSGSIEPPVTK